MSRKTPRSLLLFAVNNKEAALSDKQLLILLKSKFSHEVLEIKVEKINNQQYGMVFLDYSTRNETLVKKFGGLPISVLRVPGVETMEDFNEWLELRKNPIWSKGLSITELRSIDNLIEGPSKRALESDEPPRKRQATLEHFDIDCNDNDLSF